QERGLAAARRPHDAHVAGGAELELDLLEHRRCIAEALGDPVQREAHRARQLHRAATTASTTTIAWSSAQRASTCASAPRATIVIAIAMVLPPGPDVNAGIVA